MGISLSLPAKSNIDLSNEAKKSSMTWDEANMTWDEADFPWDLPKLVLSRESKSNIDLSNESK